MINPYLDFIFGKLGSGVFVIYLTITVYFMMHGDADPSLWLRLSEAYITYNAASYLLTDEKSLSLPSSSNRFLNFTNWFLNNFFSRKIFVLIIAMMLISRGLIVTYQLFEIGIFMLGGRMVEKFSRNIQQKIETENETVSKRVAVEVDEEEGDA